MSKYSPTGALAPATKRLVALCVALCALCVLFVAPNVLAAGDEEELNVQAPNGQGIGDVVLARGSDTTYEVTGLLASVYNFASNVEDDDSENRFGDIVLNAPPRGSSVGIRQLAATAGLGDQQFDDETPREPATLARSSRGPRDGDPAGLQFTSFAVDAIVPVVFGDEEGPAAAIESLTLAQLRGIFVTCDITNFNQIGGADAAIEVFAIQEGSGTRATFDDYLGGGALGDGDVADSSSCVTDEDNILFENNTAPIVTDIEPGEAARAIFPFSQARLGQTAIGDIQSRALNIEGIEATPETIADRSFPLSRDVFFVTVSRAAALDASAETQDALRAARRFVNFVCGPDIGRGDDQSGENIATTIDGLITTQGFGSRECMTTTTKDEGS